MVASGYRLVAFTVRQRAPGRVVHTGGDQRGTGMQARPVRQGRVAGALVERQDAGTETETRRQRERGTGGRTGQRQTEGQTDGRQQSLETRAGRQRNEINNGAARASVDHRRVVDMAGQRAL